MAKISSSAQVICWLLSHFLGDISYIQFLTACDIRIGISRIDYPHTIPCRKHHLANSSQNGWSAIKPYLLKPAAETANSSRLSLGSQALSHHFFASQMRNLLINQVVTPHSTLK